MSSESCPYEYEVVGAATSATWSDELRAHLRECSDCAESARVATWMAGAARQLGIDRTERPAPAPGYLWLKAELARRAEEAKLSAQRRQRAVVAAGLAFALVGATALLAMWPELSALWDAARIGVESRLAAASPAELGVVATAWLGLPLLLAATHLLVFSSPR